MKVGDTSPNFILKDQNGEDFELYKNLDKNILLVFYPKDDSPVCSIQLADYNDNFDDFLNCDIKLIGINTDDIQSHSKFCTKLNLNFPLLSDEDKKVSKLFNAINIFGINKRHLVLLGRDKTILWMDSTIPVTYRKTKEIVEKVKMLNLKEMT